MKTIYTIYRGKIEAHKLVRETPTGYTVIANWAKDGVTTTHIKNLEYRDCYNFNFNSSYTSENKSEAIKVAERFQEAMDCYKRDSESSVMNL